MLTRPDQDGGYRGNCFVGGVDATTRPRSRSGSYTRSRTSGAAELRHGRSAKSARRCHSSSPPHCRFSAQRVNHVPRRAFVYATLASLLASPPAEGHALLESRTAR